MHIGYRALLSSMKIIEVLSRKCISKCTWSCPDAVTPYMAMPQDPVSPLRSSPTAVADVDLHQGQGDTKTPFAKDNEATCGAMAEHSVRRP